MECYFYVFVEKCVVLMCVLWWCVVVMVEVGVFGMLSVGYVFFLF